MIPTIPPFVPLGDPTDANRPFNRDRKPEEQEKMHWEKVKNPMEPPVRRPGLKDY